MITISPRLISYCNCFFINDRYSLLEYINTIMIEAFNNCTDTDVEDIGASDYCTDYLQPLIDFWDMEVY